MVQVTRPEVEMQELQAVSRVWQEQVEEAFRSPRLRAFDRRRPHRLRLPAPGSPRTRPAPGRPQGG